MVESRNVSFGRLLICFCSCSIGMFCVANAVDIEGGCESYYITIPRPSSGDTGKNYAVLETNSTLILGESFSVCFWIIRSPLSGFGFQGTLLKYISPDAEVALSISGKLANLILEFGLMGSDLDFFLPDLGDVMDRPVWDEYCLTASSEESTASLYINGVEVGAKLYDRTHETRSRSGYFLIGSSNLCLNACVNDGTQFYGTVFRVNMWTRALEDEEIQKNYADQVSNCQCVKGDLISFSAKASPANTSWVNIIGHGNVAVSSSFDTNQRTQDGPWDSCANQLHKTTTDTVTTESGTEFSTNTSQISDGNFPETPEKEFDAFIFIIAISSGIGMILLVLIVFWLRRCMQTKKRELNSKTTENKITVTNILYSSDVKHYDIDHKKSLKKTRYVRDSEKKRHRKKIIGSRSFVKRKEKSTSEEISSISKNEIPDYVSEHIYAEIHPRYLPAILKDRSEALKQNRRLRSNPIHAYSSQVYYSVPPMGDEELQNIAKPTIYELPLESTFINPNASGEMQCQVKCDK